MVGIISDTHGLLRPEAVAALQGADHIIHAGDVGNAKILEALRKIAPLTCILGNIDRASDFPTLSETEIVELSGHTFYVIHDVKQLDLDPAAAGFSAVISGHSHQPEIETIKGVLYFNPGSAGPRRFTLPISLGKILISGAGLRAEIVTLDA